MPSQNHFDAIALLKADHRKVEDLFDEFETALIWTSLAIA
jgi:hypothetical protein